jgi:tetratricopeptide (TPR) repeat protein
MPGAMGRRRSTLRRWKAEGSHQSWHTLASDICTSSKGDLEHAIRVLEPGLVLCRASNHRANLRGIAASLGSAYALQGRLAEGRTLLEEAIREGISTGVLQGCSLQVAWLSEVCRLAGCSDEAWQHARQALDLARQYKERANEALALHQLGVVHAHTDHPEAVQAEAYYQQALALAEELGMRPLQAHCHLGLDTLYAKIGRVEQARAELAAAMALYRAMEMTFWLPRRKPHWRRQSEAWGFHFVRADARSEAITLLCIFALVAQLDGDA